MNLTATQVATALQVSENHIQKSKGIFRYHVSYFYGFMHSADKLVEKIKNTFPTATIVDSGNHYHDFVGGAKSGSAKDSFLWVKFILN